MILKNARLIPALAGGISSDNGYVVIEDGIITSVHEEPYNGEQEAFDCQGATLLPGLIDLHTHITMLGGVGLNALDDPMQLLIEAAGQASRYLEYGFTTIRDCGSINRAANYVRDMVNKKLINGPDILGCGCILMPSVIKGTTAVIANLSDGEEAFRYGVRQEFAHLSDFVKIYASGSAYNPTGVPMHPIMTEEEIRTAVETARDNGLYVAAHCHADSAIRLCIENGVRTIEHATYISEETISMLSHTADCYLVPTLAAMYVSQTDPEERAFWLARLNPMLESCAEGIHNAWCAGEIMGFGTDCVPGQPQYENGIEFRMRKENCGIPDEEILLQATKYSAKIAGLTDRGAIKQGMKADLVLVSGKPDEDISAMYGKPSHVWKNGIHI